MNGLDLFSGIGGLTKALDGYVKPIAYCENDRYAQAVLLSRMGMGEIPNAPIWDDVRTLKNSDLSSPIEIIYGGFPCQDISVAGRGAGLDGERSGLFFEIARLVSEIRPRFVFLENVPAIHIRGGDVVVGTLADLGYDCRWDVLSAADVGANHRRDRWWLLAHARGESAGRKGGRKSSRQSDSESEWNANARGRFERLREDVADAKILPKRESANETNTVAGGWGSWAKSGGGGWWSIEPNVGRVAHGVPFRVDRLRGLGNAVVPAQAREAFERLIGIK